VGVYRATHANFREGRRNPSRMTACGSYERRLHTLPNLSIAHPAIVCCVVVEYGFSSVADVCSDDCVPEKYCKG
jgi:hypothetical protein